MMKYYDRSKITEEPYPDNDTNFKEWQRVNRRRYPVINADQDQRDQLTTRLSLRSEK